MPDPTDFVNDEAPYAEQARDVSGVGQGQQTPGAAPYPLYGVPPMGAAANEPVVPFWKRAWFGWIGGLLVGGGLVYAYYGQLKPRLKPNKKKKSEG